MKLAVSDAGLAVPPVSTQLTAWNRSAGKRVFDFALASLILLPAFPLLCLVGLLIKLGSKGPVLYRQFRIGQDGREFQVMKFRTMAHIPQPDGPKVTRAGDPRVTRIGRILRKWKIDELPQLFNVVRGQMSFVGPRPDLPEYIDALEAAQKQRLLSLRPGITGLASLHYRNEEDVVSRVPSWDLQRFYCRELLPHKAALDLAYATTASFAKDCGLLLKTLLAILTPAPSSSSRH